MAQQLTFGVRVNTAHGEATVIEAAPTKLASGEVIKVRYDRPGVTITNEANERVDELEVIAGPTCMAPGCTGSATHHLRWTEFFQAKTATSCAEHLDTMVAFLKREEDLEDDEIETVQVVAADELEEAPAATEPAEGRYTVTYTRDIRETAFDGDDFRYATAVLTVTEAPLAASLTKVDLETGETTRTRIYGPEVGHDVDRLWHRVAGLINDMLRDEYEYAETIVATLPPRV